MTKTVEIPEDVDRYAQVGHEGPCDCTSEPGPQCTHLRFLLRREIAKAILLARAEQHRDDCSRKHSHPSPGFAQGDVCYVLENLRKQAAALGEEGSEQAPNSEALALRELQFDAPDVARAVSLVYRAAVR